MQKIPCGPFAKPRSNATDNNTNQNNCNSNHNILTQQNNLQPTNGQSLYNHQYRHHHHHQQANSYNNHRPPAIAVGGPCSIGLDQVDNSNASMDARPVMALTPNSLVDMQIPSGTSETSSSSEPSSSSEEWESGECCESNNPISNVSSDEMQANNKQLDVKCGVKFSNDSSSCTVESDDHDKEMIHLDYSQKQKSHKSHYSDDNYYLGSSVSLVASSATPISCPKTDPDTQTSQSLTIISASPPTKILSQRKKFKAKSGGASHATTSTGKKIRWLANMKSDPDFRETLNKNVHFRAATGLSPVRTSNDSLNSDYYSSICDKQLSFGSPAKSPSEFIRLSKVHENKTQEEECPDIVIAIKKKTPVIPVEFCNPTPPPPNTPTTPLMTDARKSPAKTENNSFKQRFFNFATRRDNETTSARTTDTEIPIIKINDETTASSTIATKASSTSSKFSFRDLRHEIQSAIKIHHQQNHTTTTTTSNSSNDNNNKGNRDKKSKKIE